jgi:NADPH2:quinone reductase
MVHAIRMHGPGGPEVLRWDEVEVGAPPPGQVHLRQTAVGLNFIDIYHRSGQYPVPTLPAVIGMEGAGVVEAVGPGVTELKQGDRVAYAAQPLGAYAQERLIPADRLVKLPDGIDERTAAAMMLRGLTAQFLLRSTYRVERGDTILVHAAAGGVGTILTQWAKHLGATVIGTVGSEEKAEFARRNGCDHTILYNREDFVARVKELTDGQGVPVVYDSVGAVTFMKGLDCLRPRGLAVLFGQSSGLVPPLDLNVLAAKGALYVTRPNFFVYTGKREELLSNASELFDVVKLGVVKIVVNQTFALKDAAEAHRALESRATTGSTVLLP